MLPEHLPGVHDVGLPGAFDGRPAGLGAGRQHHGVRSLAGDQGRIDGGVAHDPHLGAGDLALQVGDDAAELRAPGQQLGEKRLSAEPRRRLVERHPVAAGGGNGGGLHATRTAAGDASTLRGRAAGSGVP